MKRDAASMSLSLGNVRWSSGGMVRRWGAGRFLCEPPLISDSQCEISEGRVEVHGEKF